ncbi:VG15 protein [Nocardiopsis lucentensis]|uniref:VG15 protein n=1 Tax=Nocardiopsis lucentensis TaxID=53441 RepID=UPI00034A0C76|nr:hypothetical protein [Nocardiopsis lucentensis]
MSLDLALEHQAQQARIAANAARDVVNSWRDTIDPDNIRESLRSFVDEAVDVVTAAQFVTAEGAESYLDRVLPGEPPARLNPRALAGVASDGRDLSTLLARPAITALGLIAKGASVERAMAAARVSLERIVRTQVADAGRAADLTGLTARPEAVGYTRVVNLPACADCIALAGQLLSWSEGFARHPQCDCAVMPLTADDPPPQSPRELFERMSPDEQARRFGAARAEAIREGADIGQVISTRRRMSVAGRRLDAAESTTNGENSDPRTEALVDGDRVRASRGGRTMPDQIIAESNGDREAAVRGLTGYGYVTPTEGEEVSTTDDRPDSSTSSVSEQSATEVNPRLLGGNIVVSDPDAPHAQILDTVVGIIADLHALPDPIPPIPLVNEDRPNRHGAYIRFEDGTPYQFRISANSPTPHLTTAHELGHVLDHLVLGTNPRLDASTTEVEGILREWRGTVMSTALYRLLDSLDPAERGAIIGQVVSLDGTSRMVRATSDEISYLLSPAELFARSYAQWVTLRSGDDTLIEELEYVQDLTIGREGEQVAGYAQIPQQWDDEDFEPLEGVFDRLFDRMGLLEFEL